MVQYIMYRYIILFNLKSIFEFLYFPVISEKVHYLQEGKQV
jgi:hypothetical protein